MRKINCTYIFVRTRFAKANLRCHCFAPYQLSKMFAKNNETL